MQAHPRPARTLRRRSKSRPLLDIPPRKHPLLPPGVVFEPTVCQRLANLQVGAAVLLLTWLDRARRDILAVHPRDDPTRPLTGVFSTRSQDRPNPIGLHRVRITSIEDTRMGVQDLEALHGTPVLDVKPVLDCNTEQ